MRSFVAAAGSGRIRENGLLSGFESRIRFIQIATLVLFALMVGRLFVLQIIQHDFYEALASGTQDLYKSLLPARGIIAIRDRYDADTLYPLAMHRPVYQVFLDNREKPDPDKTAQAFAEVFNWDKDKKFKQYLLLTEAKPDDPYIPVPGLDRISEEEKEALAKKTLPGLHFSKKPYRYFPEGTFASNVLGFYGTTPDGKTRGMYGVEGYFQNVLAGEQGYVDGKRDAFGAWIPVAARSYQPAKDGADVILTLDKTIQMWACEELAFIAKDAHAASAASIIMNPKTGAVMAMCSYPDFDPNTYNKVASIDVYNNTAIFTAYEPGSVFKTLAMAAALDAGAITPELTYEDTGSRTIDGRTVYNALKKKYGRQTMTNVLEKSINTGMIYVVEKLGKDAFKEYVEAFGFGKKTGIELSTEVAGTISSLEKKGDIYAATASYGQGITVTPIQLVAAYAAMANGGVYMKPYIVDEIRYPDGRREKREPQALGRVISSHAAYLISGMLTSVIENTYKKTASVPGYYFGGKTGTAQVPGPGGYTEETIHTFLGYGPTEDPQFVVLAKFEKPERQWAESTGAVYFGKIAPRLVQYLHIPPTR